MRRKFSARELAEMHLPGVPSTRENCARLIARVASANPELVERRVGRGGGRVVSIVGLPSEVQAELARRESAARQREEDGRDVDKRQIVVACSADLTARQRLVAESRRAVLLMIDNQIGVTAATRSKAIVAFCGDLKAGAFDDWQLRTIKRANDKGNSSRSLSRASIYKWFAAFDAAGISALVPRIRRGAA